MYEAEIARNNRFRLMLSEEYGETKIAIQPMSRGNKERRTVNLSDGEGIFLDNGGIEAVHRKMAEARANLHTKREAADELAKWTGGDD